MEININCDLGETSKFCSTENDPLLLGIVNSANIACGYHAGDKPTMKRTVEVSKKNGVSIGAHPSFNDPDNFGRKRLNLPPLEIKKLIIDQINILNEVFTPSKEEITKAKRIIDQFHASDTGLVVIDGKLIEKPVLREMKRRILVADKINKS